jgi:hypothetical protein
VKVMGDMMNDYGANHHGKQKTLLECETDFPVQAS